MPGKRQFPCFSQIFFIEFRHQVDGSSAANDVFETEGRSLGKVKESFIDNAEDV